jgi:hypothetical protein
MDHRQGHRHPQGFNHGYLLPRSPEPTLNPASFFACPLVLIQGLSIQQICWQSFIYQLAFTAAVERARPSWPERDILAVWN